MTSAPVNEVVGGMLNRYQTAGNDAVCEGKELFSNLIGNASKLQSKEDGVAQTEQSTYSATKNFDKIQSKVKQSKASEETKSGKLDEKLGKAKETAQELQSESKKEIANQLGVSEEELEAAMEMLGLTLVDLMDPANVVKLMSELNPEMDTITIMTDETLYMQAAEIADSLAQTIQDVAKELDVSQEQFVQLVEEAFLAETNQNIMSDETMVAEVAVEVEVEETEAEKTVVADVETLEEDTEVALEKVETEKASVSEWKTDTTVPRQMTNKDEQSQSGQPNLTQTPVMQQDINVVGEQVTQIESFVDVERAQEIIDQIADYVKIHASEQITEMEIQLNPANLGNVNLSVATKNGTITAQLMTENESVRQALETQALVLKEELQEQGLKVDAIEVTIAGHGFERNLDENQGQNEAEAEYAQKLQKETRRRINLEGLSQDEVEAMSEGLSEAEMIQIDMMNRSGNKIDFMA